jgi:hypothetical protein
MKKLLLIFIAISFSAFGSEVVLECDHASKDNWPLGGRLPIISMEIDTAGAILAATIDEVPMGVENNILIENPGQGPKRETYYVIQSSDELQNAEAGAIVPVEVQFDGYLAAFNEVVDCEVLSN